MKYISIRKRIDVYMSTINKKCKLFLSPGYKMLIAHVKSAQDDDLDDIEDDLESGEELEDGEISDEDETLKNERNEPKPICRFYSKGQCTWGASCRSRITENKRCSEILKQNN